MNSSQDINQTDHQLFNVLYQNYSEKIYRLAGKFFTTTTDREDVVQETFMRIYRNIHQHDVSKNSSAWIYKIGTNICLDIIRRRKSRKYIDNVGLGDQKEIIDKEPCKMKTPEQIVVKTEDNERLMKAINQLPQKWKPFIYQRYILEMSLEEISIANQMPIGTVKSRIHRAINYLHRDLGNTDLND